MPRARVRLLAKVKKKPQHYVDNIRLYEALKEYRAQPEPRQMSNEIGSAIMKICHGLSLAYNFRNYSYRDEMIDDAVENVIYAVPFFDPAKSNNPFGYFTLVAWRAFIRRIQAEQKQNYIKHKNFEKNFIESGGLTGAPNEYSREVIEKFERRLAEQKKKTKEAGLLKLAAQQDAEEDIELDEGSSDN
jgi:hypothetical protein